MASAFTVSDTLLDRVRVAATRAKTKAYDDELKTYIIACLYDLDRLNILFDDSDPEEEIITAVILFVKSKFGTSNASYKESMAKAYADWRELLLVDKSHSEVI